MKRKTLKTIPRTIKLRELLYYAHSDYSLLRNAKKAAKKAIEKGYKISLQKKRDQLESDLDTIQLIDPEDRRKSLYI